MILYLHGFRSSPQSFKARMMAEAMRERGRENEWRCPALPPGPRAAIEVAQEAAAQLQRATGRPAQALTVIGSSLGGYYATWLAERLGCKAVLLNPAVHAARDLATQVGPQSGYHDGQPFEFKASYVDELKALEIPRISRPGRYFLIAATGDEVLDWREMRDHYAGARQRIVEGSDHGLGDFARWLPEVLEFADAPVTDSH
ncbi:YqiA/YcfP family alpha/beta fold hydrolase [Pigmentiphaga soli]|uniref:YqiA/YcfP family alpha/beta fold hydrolase n=1 Tax=Pigmentiphaga soli TaxID=1007095 RepID=UPI0031EEBBAA